MSSVNVTDSINSGQVFLWKRHDGSWYGINGESILQVSENFEQDSSSESEYEFFRLSDNYDMMLKSISKDPVIRRAVKKYRGLRLLRQDPFQCYISFIVSSNSNIPNIRLRLKKLCQKFGKKKSFKNDTYYVFPNPKKLADAPLGQLQQCGLGYRTKFVKQASQKIADGQIDFDDLKKQSYQTVKSTLVQVPGIGNKVADCIMLFSLEKLDAFPLDTWMLKALEEFYAKRFSIKTKSITTKKYEMLHNQVVSYFGAFAGLSQQFLFKSIRDQNLRGW